MIISVNNSQSLECNASSGRWKAHMQRERESKQTPCLCASLSALLCTWQTSLISQEELLSDITSCFDLAGRINKNNSYAERTLFLKPLLWVGFFLDGCLSLTFTPFYTYSSELDSGLCRNYWQYVIGSHLASQLTEWMRLTTLWGNSQRMVFWCFSPCLTLFIETGNLRGKGIKPTWSNTICFISSKELKAVAANENTMTVDVDLGFLSLSWLIYLF